MAGLTSSTVRIVAQPPVAVLSGHLFMLLAVVENKVVKGVQVLLAGGNENRMGLPLAGEVFADADDFPVGTRQRPWARPCSANFATALMVTSASELLYFHRG
jgi:hypothetical protein